MFGDCQRILHVLVQPSMLKNGVPTSFFHLFAVLCMCFQGFVRVAVKYGYSIIPFASVGVEDAARVAFTVNLSWIVRQVDKNHGPMRIPILYPYNSLERQVITLFPEEACTVSLGDVLY